MAVISRVRSRRAFFTHVCHDLDHEETDRALPEGVGLAYDGLVLELASGQPFDGAGMLPATSRIW